jgi:hypothetical protein
LLSVYSNIYDVTVKDPGYLNVITVEPGAAGGVVIGLANVGSGNFLLKALAGSITSVSPGNNVADIVAAHVDLKVTGETSTIGTSETSQLDINGSTLTPLIFPRQSAHSLAVSVRIFFS